MRFSCEKNILSEAVSICSRAISTRSTMPILEGLCITAGDDITVTGYNLKTGIRSSFEADIQEKGSIVLNAKLFGDIVRRLPDDVLDITVDEKNMATIKCGYSEFNIVGTDALEFPTLPVVSQHNKITLTEEKLKSMIAQTIFAVSTNENKPVHTGSLFEIENQTLTMVSVDGFRLALRKESIEDDVMDQKFVVPGETLKEIEHLLTESEDKVAIYPDDKQILFAFQNVIIITRLLEGDFLNYKTTIQMEASNRYVVNTKNLMDSIERVSLIVNERLKTPIRCHFSDDLVRFNCVTALGKSYDECPIEGKGDEIEIGFNHRYLLDTLKACQEEEAVLELKSGLMPCVVKPSDGSDKYLFLVLPVRLKAE